MDNLILPQQKKGNRRRAYYKEYGPPLARQAEFDVMVGMMLAYIGVKPEEFFDRVEAFLRLEDEARKAAASFHD